MSSRSKHLLTDNTQHQRWIVPYSDLITLLFTFFVVMYSISTVNLEKYKKAAQSIERAFTANVINHFSESNAENSPLLSSFFQINETDTMTSYFAEAGEIFNRLFKGQLLSDLEDDWLAFELDAEFTFDKGQMIVKSEALSALSKLADYINNNPVVVAVEGHTDNIPIQNEIYSSNWELSAVRAATVSRKLVELGVDAKKLITMAYGDQYPIADNQQVAGRQKNRRVTIIIAKDKTSNRLLDPMQSKAIKQRYLQNLERDTTRLIDVVNELPLPQGGVRLQRGQKRIPKE